jgi:hypothetical protein
MAPKTLVVKCGSADLVTFKRVPNDDQKLLNFDRFLGFYSNLKYSTKFVKPVVKNTRCLEIRGELSNYKIAFEFTKRAKIFDAGMN